jgi:hypothetical protein
MPAARERLGWFGQIVRPSGLRVLQPDEFCRQLGVSKSAADLRVKGVTYQR